MSWRERCENLAQRLADVVFDWRQYKEGLPSARPRLVAHRGCWDHSAFLENTLPAFKKARDLGAWAIEFDVRFTRDNVPVVNHDASLLRGHGSRAEVHQLTWAELQGEAPRVPLLTDVLALRDLHFMIEIKEPMSNVQQESLNEALGSLKPVTDFHLLTLRPEIVQIDARFPSEAWILVGDLNIKSLLESAKARPVGGLAGHYLTLTKSVLAELRHLGMKSGTGFAPSVNLFRREWSRGVTWVFTNDLEKIVRDEEWKSR